ncbi:hypothetical protein LZ30DRAFT_770042, partial [Colletotrichum cereale]
QQDQDHPHARTYTHPHKRSTPPWSLSIGLEPSLLPSARGEERHNLHHRFLTSCATSSVRRKPSQSVIVTTRRRKEHRPWCTYIATHHPYSRSVTSQPSPEAPTPPLPLTHTLTRLPDTAFPSRSKNEPTLLLPHPSKTQQPPILAPHLLYSSRKPGSRHFYISTPCAIDRQSSCHSRLSLAAFVT